jgi:putative SOS response-associated peptidase YedK
MCAIFTPSKKPQIARHFDVDVDAGPLDHADTFPGHTAPIIRPARASGPGLALACDPACFGLVPHWADIKLARSTYNARTETVAGKPSFRDAWRRRQLCIIPAQDISEQCYEDGAPAPVRWRIARTDKAPLAIAGIWDIKPDGPDGGPLLSFSMLTVNATGHALMERFNKPEDEKRMVVILDPAQYRPWLRGELMSSAALFRPYPAADLLGFADPLPPRAKAGRLERLASRVQKAEQGRPFNPDQGDLF